MGTGDENLTQTVKALMSRDAYPGKVGCIRLVETHVSYLFFTEDFVYKVKKPVDYGFLDFTSLEKRKLYCDREVALNSRISPDVYFGVVPIREQDGHIKIEGPGTIVEYAVKMRRLPQERALNELLQRDLVSLEDIRRVAARVAEFHKTAETNDKVTRLGDLSVVWQNVEENFQQTRQYIGVSLNQDEFDDLAAYSRAFMDAKSEVFERRAREGRVRDGHGDLHTANVFLDDGIHIIDCIEFNNRFRCQDVAEDIAFMAMDLDFYGRRDLSEAFVAEYVREAQDPEVNELLDFFKAYRAYVRGKVTSFRLDDETLSKDKREETQAAAQAYFSLAHSYTKSVFKRPALVLVTGLMGTGKTYIGLELARRWGMGYVSSDATRKNLAGVAATEHRYEAYGQGIYSSEFTRLTYDALFEDARQRLARGESVVLDATFRAANERQMAVDVALEAEADFYIVECVTSEDEIKRRLDRRLEEGENTVSDGRWELFQQQKADWEPVAEVPERSHIRLDTTGPPEDNIRELLRLLFARALSD